MWDASDQPLVSIIIPCYNAERWLSECIDSCLNQTYRTLEIIVIDDGSTDSSLHILKSYGAKIRYETGPNRGGNHARNRGFAISRGEFIQFLDADDYILPEKVESQVKFLEQTQADVVYGDWRSQRHLPDGRSYLEDIVISNRQQDILRSLLSCRWYVIDCALLYRRHAVINAGGWDESVEAGQDKDFLLSVIMSGAKIAYQPGCFSIYRKYGSVTVSSSNLPRYLKNHSLILEKAEHKLNISGMLSREYRKSLAAGYFHFARPYHHFDPAAYAQLLKRALELDPDFEPVGESFAYRAIQSICGYDLTEQLYTTNLLAKSALKRTPLLGIYRYLIGRVRYYHYIHLKAKAGRDRAFSMK